MWAMSNEQWWQSDILAPKQFIYYMRIYKVCKFAYNE